ncbi:hypothetical protein P7K49_022835 [Saguinus oedipus]|uniref:Peptidase S1 domain-containing protein n=1 Tax=Saguinus oedipus TaxID=9490 RepID=A0ABQ9UJY3_SAGOE|nr:hypothetical protein P7K49_022835 [Saguinus oedipus]
MRRTCQDEQVVATPQSPLLGQAPGVLRQPALHPGSLGPGCAQAASPPSGSLGPGCAQAASPPSGSLTALFSSISYGDRADYSGWTVQFGQLTSAPPFWSLQAYYTRYLVSNIYLSPQYLGNSPYDIALVKLSTPVTYTNHIQPICLLASTFEFENRTDCWVTGWGNIQEDEDFPSALPGSAGRYPPYSPYLGVSPDDCCLPGVLGEP